MSRWRKTMGGVTLQVIRHVTDADISALVGLMHGYIVDFYQAPDPGLDAIEAFARHLLDHPELGRQWVADEGGELSGFATCYFTFSTLRLKRTTILNDLYVVPDRRRHGIGEALLAACLEHAREGDSEPVIWETARDNQPAQALYERAGAGRSPWIHYEYPDPNLAG